MELNDVIAVIVTAIVAVLGGILAFTAEQQATVVAGITTIIASILAYYQTHKKGVVTDAYTAGSPAASNPDVVATLPVRSWQMTESTKRWLTFDATPENKAKILAQIEAAEADRKTKYRIEYAGGYYDIEYGALVGSSGNPSGK